MPTQFCTGTKCCTNHKLVVDGTSRVSEAECKDFVIIGIIMIIITITNVIIPGNGPSGISLSYFLSGNWPHYTGVSQDEFLHTRLMVEPHLSLVEQDLEFLSDVGEKCISVASFPFPRGLKEGPTTQCHSSLMLFRSQKLI